MCARASALVLAAGLALPLALPAMPGAVRAQAAEPTVASDSSPRPSTGAPAGAVDALGIASGAWEATDTRHFRILATRDGAAARDHLAARADGILEGLVAVFGPLPGAEPLTLRLFGDPAAYRVARPLTPADTAASVRPGGRGIDLDLAAARAGLAPGTASQVGLDRALRHALTALIAGRMSDDRLPDGFAAGLARFMEGPPAEAESARAAGVARLREARDRHTLHAWADLNAPGASYLDPPLAGPQNLSIVHFLVATRGFAPLAAFLRGMAGAPGWRHALEQAYGLPPLALEAEWLAWLPTYLDGGWRRHPLYDLDLGPAETLIARGDYAGAAAQLRGMGALQGPAGPAEDALRRLLERADAGRAAREALSGAAASLSDGAYPQALAAAEAAQAVLEDLGDAEGAALAGALAERARIGIEAGAALRRAERLPTWRSFQARPAALAAAEGFARIGNDLAAERARSRLKALDRRLAPAGWSLFALGVLVLGWNLRLRRRDRIPDRGALAGGVPSRSRGTRSA